MATYSINIGTPTESTKLGSLTDVLNKLPNNSSQLIKPRDVRDAIFTTWENSVFKFNLVTTSTTPYIGFNDTFSATRNKVLLGKNKWTTQETLNAGLLSNDVDHYFFNVKDDTNPNQNTKVAFLGGTDDTLYPNAPYIEAEYISSPTRIDMAIGNPGGLIELQSDRVDIGNSGWVVDNGVLYPSVDGQSLGASPSNRIGTIYMSSTIDYLGSLEFVGTSFSSTLDDQGELTVNSIITQDIFVSNNFQLSTSATAGYVLKSDGLGNAIWQQDSFDATGITAGWVVKADGSGNSIWSMDIVDTTGVTAGQIVVADGSGGIGYASPTTVSAQGNNGYVQFAEFGLITADSNFYWDNTNKRLGIGTTGPSYDLDVNGTINSININGLSSSIVTGSFSTINSTNANITDIQGVNATFSNAILVEDYTSLTNGEVLIGSQNSDGWSNIIGESSELLGSWFVGVDEELGSEVGFGTKNADPIHLVTSSVPRLSINSNGDVGIGTTTPDAKLHITNSASEPSLIVNGKTEIIKNGDSPTLNLRYDSPTNVSGVTISSIKAIVGTNSNSTSYAEIEFDSNSGGEIVFKTTNNLTIPPSEAMRIDRIGDVSVEGSLSVQNSRIFGRNSNGVWLDNQTMTFETYNAFIPSHSSYFSIISLIGSVTFQHVYTIEVIATAKSNVGGDYYSKHFTTTLFLPGSGSGTQSTTVHHEVDTSSGDANNIQVSVNSATSAQIEIIGDGNDWEWNVDYRYHKVLSLNPFVAVIPGV